MSDFYSVLRQSIIDRGLRSAAEREVTYDQARKAMIRRLWSYDPPMSEDEIDARIGLFDAAVERIEADVVEVFASLPPPVASGPQRPAPGRDLPVYDGYDRESDYAPAFGFPAGGNEDSGRYAAEPPRDPRGGGANLPSTYRPGRMMDTLDARSLAVEDALNSNHPDQAHEQGHDDFAEPGFADEATYEAAAEETEARWHDRQAPDQWPPPAAVEVYEPSENWDDAAEPSRTRRAASHEPERRQGPATPPAPSRRVLVRPDTRRADARRVRILAVAIGALLIALAGVAAYVIVPTLLPPADDTALLVDKVPGGVSDADTARRIPTLTINVARTINVFDGTDPTVFKSDPDNPVRFDGNSARIATSTASAGARVAIGPGLSNRLAGHRIRITIDARSARENGASTLRFAYQSGLAISHWQAANLSPDYTPLGLVWRVPALRTERDNAILIEPGIPGSGTGVEIRSIKVDLVGDEEG